MNVRQSDRRWFSTAEFCARYGVLQGTARRWARQGKITSIRIPPAPRGKIYILDPVWLQIDTPSSADPAEWFCCLRQCEVAHLLGITPRALRYKEADGKAHYRRVGHRKLYSVQEVRRLIAQRAVGNGRRSQRETCQGMLCWAASQLRQK
jgi:hypothetical protein